MNVSSLPYSLDITSTTGSTLSAEELYVVQNSLVLLQHENQFTQIYFWGKIFGTEKDYYIAFGYPKKAKRGRSFYYSTNQRDWAVLNGPTPRALKFLPKVFEHFHGDPSYVLDCKQIISLISGDSDCADTGMGSEFYLKEEDRLAAVVMAISADCAIAPVGAFKSDCSELNPVFQGLSLDEGSDLHGWMHITETSNCDAAAQSDNSQQCLRGKWSVCVRGHRTVCVLRSLEWHGFTAYHRLRTPDYGFVYFGEGIKTSAMERD